MTSIAIVIAVVGFATILHLWDAKRLAAKKLARKQRELAELGLFG